MKRDLHLLIIDPQNDFCDLPASYCPSNPVTGHQEAPALPVNGAHQDMLRVAQLIHSGGSGLSAISITLDSHHRLDIAHPTFWIDATGHSVEAFTPVPLSKVRAGKFKPRDPRALPRTLEYLERLESSGRYQLMVWPVHCEIGTWGHNVHADVRHAYNRWEDGSQGIVNKINKGSNPWTEHYSAIMAEVPDAGDPATQLNRGLVELLGRADQVYITGEAGSHCVRATTEHLVEHIDQDKLSRLVLLTDCMSAVTGFESHFSEFIKDMTARGLQIATAADVLPHLVANGRR